MSETEDRFSRQILAFGQEGQRRIASVRAGIVGLGGTGSCVSQMLAHLGVNEILLVDDDTVEESNLNRLIGATVKDVTNKTPKVDVAKRVIHSVNSKAKVTALSKNLRSEQAIDSLCQMTEIIFGCVDNDGARLIMTELAAAYQKTLIDTGTEIIHNQEFEEFGGRVIVAQPGDFCLLCADQIDLSVAQKELESEQEKIGRQKLGYGLGEKLPDPAVISLNSIMAGLAVTEFLMLVTGLRAPNRRVTYKGMRGVFRESLDEKRKDCYVCHSLVGKRQGADIKRFVRKGLPKDLPAL